MQAYPAVSPPSDDKRWRIVEGTMRRHGRQADSLIEVLHTVQESFGYLDQPSLQFVARSLRLPYSKVFGVATFYHFFTLKPKGLHTCVVCTGTACYIKGSPALLRSVEETAQIQPGETTPDNQVSLYRLLRTGARSRVRWRDLRPGATRRHGPAHAKVAAP